MSKSCSKTLYAQFLPVGVRPSLKAKLYGQLRRSPVGQEISEALFWSAGYFGREAGDSRATGSAVRGQSLQGAVESSGIALAGVDRVRLDSDEVCAGRKEGGKALPAACGRAD